MPSLETTNWILAVIAAATAAQFLMLFIGALWVAKRIADIQETVTKTLERFEATYVPELSAKVSGLVDDFHRWPRAWTASVRKWSAPRASRRAR